MLHKSCHKFTRKNFFFIVCLFPRNNPFLPKMTQKWRKIQKWPIKWWETDKLKKNMKFKNFRKIKTLFIVQPCIYLQNWRFCDYLKLPWCWKKSFYAQISGFIFLFFSHFSAISAVNCNVFENFQKNTEIFFFKIPYFDGKLLYKLINDTECTLWSTVKICLWNFDKN